MWRGVFPQKNGLGHYMLLSVITYTLVHFDRAGLGSKYRLFNLAMLFLAAFLLVISDSITSQLLALIGAAILIYVAFIRRTGLVFVPLLLLGVWIAAMIAWVVVSDPGAYTGMVGRDATLSGRTHVWQLAILLVEKKPLLGYGYGTDVLERFVSWIHVHNGFIWMAMQFGLVGLTLLMVFLVQTGWRCYAAAKGSSGSLALWPLGVFVVLVMRNFSEVSFLGSNSLAWCLLIYFSSNETLARWGGSEDSTP